jgi:predicted nucleotidyltransferase
VFIQKVIRALNKHRVKYILVGGYAVALHGAVRGTVDVDIAITLKRATFKRAENALLEVGLESRLPVTAEEVFSFREEYIQKRNLTAWSFANPHNPLEVVDILITEDADGITAVNKQAFGMSVRIAAIPDLIAMKKKAGRAQDLEDIKALRKLQ